MSINIDISLSFVHFVSLKENVDSERLFNAGASHFYFSLKTNKCLHQIMCFFPDQEGLSKSLSREFQLYLSKSSAKFSV
jgi:hypothetical protein